MRSITTDVCPPPWSDPILSHHAQPRARCERSAPDRPMQPLFTSRVRTTSWVWCDAAIARSVAEGCCLRRLPQPSVRSFSRCLRRTCQISGGHTASDPWVPTYGVTQADQASVVSSVFFSSRWKRSRPSCPDARRRRRDRVIGRGRCGKDEIGHCSQLTPREPPAPFQF